MYTCPSKDNFKLRRWATHIYTEVLIYTHLHTCTTSTLIYYSDGYQPQAAGIGARHYPTPSRNPGRTRMRMSHGGTSLSHGSHEQSRQSRGWATAVMTHEPDADESRRKHAGTSASAVNKLEPGRQCHGPWPWSVILKLKTGTPTPGPPGRWHLNFRHFVISLRKVTGTGRDIQYYPLAITVTKKSLAQLTGRPLRVNAGPGPDSGRGLRPLAAARLSNLRDPTCCSLAFCPGWCGGVARPSSANAQALHPMATWKRFAFLWTGTQAGPRAGPGARTSSWRSQCCTSSSRESQTRRAGGPAW